MLLHSRRPPNLIKAGILWLIILQIDDGGGGIWMVMCTLHQPESGQHKGTENTVLHSGTCDRTSV